MDTPHSEKYGTLSLSLTVAFGLAVIALAVVGPVWVSKPIPWTGVSSLAFVVALAVGMIVRRKRSTDA
jgi:hypothetical protein